MVGQPVSEPSSRRGEWRCFWPNHRQVMGRAQCPQLRGLASWARVLKPPRRTGLPFGGWPLSITTSWVLVRAGRLSWVPPGASRTSRCPGAVPRLHGASPQAPGPAALPTGAVQYQPPRGAKTGRGGGQVPARALLAVLWPGHGARGLPAKHLWPLPPLALPVSLLTCHLALCPAPEPACVLAQTSPPPVSVASPDWDRWPRGLLPPTAHLSTRSGEADGAN